MYADQCLTSTQPTLQDHNNQWALQLIIPASDWSVRYSLHSIKTGISHLGFTQEDISNVELITAEVLNNIVEHAYDGIEKGMIEIELLFQNKELTCVITDNGHPMPNGMLPAGHSKNVTVPIPDLPEGGFGWLLIQRLTCKLSYARQGSKNKLSYQIRTSKHKIL